MTGALIILAVTVVAGLVLFLAHKKEEPGQEAPSPDVPGPEECCGRHIVCDKVSAAAGPVYFDDEELDRFAGREPVSYTPGEIEEFRSVLYTLLPDDVYPWGASLSMRDIALPDVLRDEWIMLCGK